MCVNLIKESVEAYRVEAVISNFITSDVNSVFGG